MKTYWTCKNCNDQVEDVFEVCWNCQYDREGNPPSEVDERAVRMAMADRIERRRLSEKHKDKHCAQCETLLTYMGTRRVQKGQQSVLDELAELAELEMLLANEIDLEMYSCERCGRYEFFCLE